MHACIRPLAHPTLTLQDLWSVAQQEAVGRYLVRALAWLFFRTKRLTGRLPRWARWTLMPPLRWLSGEGRGGGEGGAALGVAARLVLLSLRH